MVKRTKTPLPKTVKEFVDFIYEYLIEHPDGLSFPMKSIVETRTQKRVASILIQRGIIEKTFIPAVDRRGVSYKYKWVATMAPTKTLYGSIVTELRNEQSKWPSYKKKKAMEKKKPVFDEKPNVVADVAAQEPTPIEPTPVFTGFGPFDGFSDQELWDELKRRGYSIEDNRLVIVKKTYLN